MIGIPKGFKMLNADCMDIMKDLKDNEFDLAIVDPPYRDAKNNDMNQWNRKHIRKGRLKNWQNKPRKSYFKELFRVSKNQIIWGANNFELPPYSGFVIWRKLSISEGFNMSMCEVAYLSKGLGTISKVFEKTPQIKNRIHPTQKPLELYEWLLKKYANKGDKILDTHLGSGTSAIACYSYNFDFLGIEINKEYYDDAKKRFKEYIKQIELPITAISEDDFNGLTKKENIDNVKK